MKYFYLTVMFTVFPALAMAQTSSDPQAPSQTAASVVAPPSSETNYFCYYAGVPYSQGAIINLNGGGRLICQTVGNAIVAGSTQPLGWAFEK